MSSSCRSTATQNVRISVPKIVSDEIARNLFDSAGRRVALLQEPLRPTLRVSARYHSHDRALRTRCLRLLGGPRLATHPERLLTVALSGWRRACRPCLRIPPANSRRGVSIDRRTSSSDRLDRGKAWSLCFGLLTDLVRGRGVFTTGTFGGVPCAVLWGWGTSTRFLSASCFFVVLWWRHLWPHGAP